MLSLAMTFRVEVKHTVYKARPVSSTSISKNERIFERFTLKYQNVQKSVHQLSRFSRAEGRNTETDWQQVQKAKFQINELHPIVVTTNVMWSLILFAALIRRSFCTAS